MNLITVEDIEKLFPVPEGETEETWKLLESYPDYYVSSLGRVVSAKRRIPILMKIFIGAGGMLQVTIASADNKAHGERVARLVAKAFVPNPDNLQRIEFLDGNPNNCRVSNLKWTPATTVMTETYHARKKRVNQYHLDGTYIRTFESVVEAAETTGVFNIASACSGRISKAGGYIWKYEDDHPAEDLKNEKVKSSKKKVAQYTMDGEFVAEYDSVSEANKSLGKGNNTGNIARCCNGKRPHACGYIWKYVTD